MLFAVGAERVRALQSRPFRGYDARRPGACLRVTSNEPELTQYPEAAGRGLGVEAMRARAAERGPQLGTRNLARGAERAEGARDRLPRGRLAGEGPAAEPH